MTLKRNPRLGPNGRTYVSFRAPSDLIETARSRAAAEQANLSYWLVEAIRRAIAETTNQ